VERDLCICCHCVLADLLSDVNIACWFVGLPLYTVFELKIYDGLKTGGYFTVSVSELGECSGQASKQKKQ
jgi:hypothetical protein